MEQDKISKKILNPEEFKNLWKELPEFLQQRRLRRAYNVIKPVIREQIFLLDEYKKSTDKEKSEGHLYVFNTVKNFYDNVKLTFLMGRNKSMRNFVFYPARTCMETLMRFMYFCRQSQDEKDNITNKELLRIYARLYKREKLEGIINKKYIDAYNHIAGGLDVSNIDDVKEDKELDPFLNMYELCRLSGRKDPQNEYFIYKCLCEDAHGKLIATVIRSQSEKHQNFRRAVMLLINFCKEMLILVDKEFLDSRQRKRVEFCIKRADEMVMGPKSFFEKIFKKKK